MTAVGASRRTAMGTSIARRAVDLALDGRVSVDEGADHLIRLAMGRRAPLENAIRELGFASPSSPDEACACLLLQRALACVVPSAAIPPATSSTS